MSETTRWEPPEVNRPSLDFHEDERRQAPEAPDLPQIEELAATPAWQHAARMLAFAISGITLEMPADQAERIIEEALRRLRAEVQQTIGEIEESPYWTIEEAANFARTTPDRIRKLRSRGVLSAHADGGNALVLREELREWCKQPTKRGRST